MMRGRPRHEGRHRNARGSGFHLVDVVAVTLAAQESSSAARSLPPYYTVKSQCIPGRGYVALAEAPGHTPELPLLALFVYGGEVIGVLFEAHEKDGWRPWYNERVGEAVSHDGGPAALQPPDHVQEGSHGGGVQGGEGSAATLAHYGLARSSRIGHSGR